MRAAFVIGDDAIRQESQGWGIPHAFTQGSSGQRMRWFKKGWEPADWRVGDTFSGRYEAP